jgi:hypothetical protein
MRNILLTIALSTFASFPAYAQTPAAAPTGTAYQGVVGDWALGRWTGYRYSDASFSSMAANDRVLIVTKLPDGRVACQYGTPTEVARGGWASQCAITATTIALRAGTADVELSRAGKELEGKYNVVGARIKVHLHRGDQHESAVR